jgi:ribonucleoside-diphosphate reductase beta chain
VAVREGFQSTSTGLRSDILPMRLYEKAKRLGTWDPSALDLARDRDDWTAMEPQKQEAILQITSLFLAGEEAVTLDLLPLVLAIAREGRLEEELFLTTFLFEEGKHTQFFRRFLDEVADSPSGLEDWHTPSYKTLFYDELPQAMNALLTDASPAAQARAAVTYNMIIEGVLAETGYHVYHESLTEQDLLPGLRAGLVHVKRDEARHVAYGVYLLSRLVSAQPALWEQVEARMNELLPVALGFVAETFEPHPDGITPFGMERDKVIAYSASQYQKRFDRIERARGRTLADLDGDPDDDGE